MITILIAQDENKVKEILTQMLRQEGYAVSDRSQDNIIKIIKEGSEKGSGSFQDRILELEESLYREKEGVLYKSILEVVEKALIEDILGRTEGNQLKAARILGINRNTLHTKIKKLGVNPDIYKR
jgi:two-component system nitrogen regulation response regulator GlnG